MQEKKDFVSKKVSFSEFLQAFTSYWPKFITHHNDAKWHDDDFISMKTKLRRGHVVMVIDFAENYSHQPRFEHQSKYFSQVQTTIVPVVLMLRVEDAINIGEGEKGELIELFSKLDLPPVICETHFIISSDMQHDNPFVQKGLDDHIIPYIQSAMPATTCIHVRSDGCKASAHQPVVLLLWSFHSKFYFKLLFSHNVGSVQVCLKLFLGLTTTQRGLHDSYPLVILRILSW